MPDAARPHTVHDETLGDLPVWDLSDLYPGPESDALAVEEAAARPDAPTTTRPDIYLIVLDAYGRDDELAEFFGLEVGLGQDLAAIPGRKVMVLMSNELPTFAPPGSRRSTPGI